MEPAIVGWWGPTQLSPLWEHITVLVTSDRIDHSDHGELYTGLQRCSARSDIATSALISLAMANHMATPNFGVGGVCILPRAWKKRNVSDDQPYRRPQWGFWEPQFKTAH